VITKHGVRGGLVGASILVAATATLVSRGGRLAAAAGAPVRDTVKDSLLVSDSVYQGWKWFAVYCFRCHGEDAMHPILPSAPDLRWAVSPTGANFPRDSFVNTALNGRLDKGMPSWKALLDTSAINELYLYVKARSDGWLKPGRPHRLSDQQSKNK
jgi:mono/diheme cytochrome c family protein